MFSRIKMLRMATEFRWKPPSRFSGVTTRMMMRTVLIRPQLRLSGVTTQNCCTQQTNVQVSKHGNKRYLDREKCPCEHTFHHKQILANLQNMPKENKRRQTAKNLLMKHEFIEVFFD